MKKIILMRRESIPQAIEVLAKRGARPFTVTLSTCPKWLKKSRKNGLGLPDWMHDVRKVSVINCFLNFDYEKAVNRQREREGTATDFQTQANWFEHVAGLPSCLVRNRTPDPTEKNQWYVQLKIERIMSVEYVSVKGQRWTREEFEALYGGYLPIKSNSKGTQALARPILTMTPSLESIVSFTVDGQTYVVGKEVSANAKPLAITISDVYQEQEKQLIEQGEI